MTGLVFRFSAISVLILAIMLYVDILVPDHVEPMAIDPKPNMENDLNPIKFLIVRILLIISWILYLPGFFLKRRS